MDSWVPLSGLNIDGGFESVVLNAEKINKKHLEEFHNIRRSTIGADRLDILESTWLKESSPFFQSAGCWLQGICQPIAYEDPLGMTSLILLSGEVGVGKPNNSRADKFLTLLKQKELTFLASKYDFLEGYNGDLSDDAFAFPTILLALSKRSDIFLSELCGIDLVIRSIGLFPFLKVMKNTHSYSWDNLDFSMFDGEKNSAILLSKKLTQVCISLDKKNKIKILLGAAWCIEAINKWLVHIKNKSLNMIEPSYQMISLIQKVSEDAAVYHKRTQLKKNSGCPMLNDLFLNSVNDPYSLVTLLSESKFVVKGSSHKSPLIKALVSSNGPMFRIFNEDEILIISRWIDSLNEDSKVPLKACKKSREVDEVIGIGNDDLGQRPKSVREAYFLLQTCNFPPKLSQFADEFINFRLINAKKALQKDCSDLLAKWEPNRLKFWLKKEHIENSSIANNKDSYIYPSREEVIESSIQLAPLTLIDGAWLQGFTNITLSKTSVGFRLFQIYWDELGNGKIELNHPKIYRDSLLEMGVNLPQTGEYEFSQSSIIKNDSFLLPVYWLCLAKLPKSYLPEILGLNLAMELSGVGNGYVFAKAFLKKYNFSTRFVDLHNTIDNVISGHSAWALEAIDAYMESLSEHCDIEELNKYWERVQVGYKSLGLPPQTFEF